MTTRDDLDMTYPNANRTAAATFAERRGGSGISWEMRREMIAAHMAGQQLIYDTMATALAKASARGARSC